MTDDLVNIETFEFVQEAEAARDLLEVAWHSRSFGGSLIYESTAR